MRWRALQEGSMFVKQNLNEDQLEVTDIQEMINNGDKHLADRIMRYGEGLRGSRQFWMLHMLMNEGECSDNESDSAKERQQNIIDNPHIAT